MMFVKSAKLTTQKLEDGKFTLVFQNVNTLSCAHVIKDFYTDAAFLIRPWINWLKLILFNLCSIKLLMIQIHPI